MKYVTGKRLAALGLAAVLALAVTACGEKQPSQEEVEQAIEAGTLTVEDALDKGWIDQAWVEAYQEENSVPAASKMETNMVGDFTTVTLSGEAFTREKLGDVVFFAFLDPNAEGTQAFYDALTQPEAVRDFYQNSELVAMTRELTEMLRKNRTIDWQKKETARAGMRKMVKRLLKKYKYPPEGVEDAINTVISQCEMWTDHMEA